MQNAVNQTSIAAERSSLSKFFADHIWTGVPTEPGAGKIGLEQSQALYLMRGFAILIVVIVHITQWPTRFAFFCMPLFFFVSGYLFVPPKALPGYFVNLTRKLMVPYFVFMAIIAAPNVTRLFLEGGAAAGFDRIGHLLIGGEQIRGIWAAYWYIPCFFFMHIAYTLSSRVLSPKAMTVLCIPLWGLAIWNHYAADFWLPLAINVVAMAFPLMHAGWLYRNREFSQDFDRSFHIGAAIIGGAYTIPAAFYLVPGLDTKFAEYGFPVVTVFCAILMVIVTKVLADRLREYHVLNLTLGEIGKASLIIMFAHQAIQMSIVSVFDIYFEPLRIVVSVGLSYVLFRWLRSSRIGGAIFLGKPLRLPKAETSRPGPKAANALA